MTSIERMLNYTKLEQEAELKLPADEQVPTGWPSEGCIEFKDVKFRYRKELDNTLKGIDLVIEGGKKVGCCGRTGAGKSSMIQAIFRMCELSGGKIEIDGVDCSKLGLNFLRKTLSIIPQTPVMFIGTIRYNIDPLSEYTYEAIWEVLKEV